MLDLGIGIRASTLRAFGIRSGGGVISGAQVAQYSSCECFFVQHRRKVHIHGHPSAPGVKKILHVA